MTRSRPFSLALACLLALAPPGLAQPAAEQHPIQDDESRLLPVVAAHGMVASQEARATRVGVDILKAGGNAIDAAVAVGLSLIHI